MKHKQALFHSAKDEKGKSNQRRARGKTKIFMEMYSFSKGKEILTHDKTQFESVHMSEAHTKWRQEFKGVNFNFFQSNICYHLS